MAPRVILSFIALALAGCASSTPSPLAPALRGSIGVPHHGVITDAVPLPRQGEGFRLLRSGGPRWASPRLIAAIRRAAGEVWRARPGGEPLVVGDLSAQRGGETRGHRSHRTGRDADLLLYALTPDGRPIRSPGFVRFGPDGLAIVDDGQPASAKPAKKPEGPANAESRPALKLDDFVRLDVEREWLLVKALMGSPDANVQWLFISRPIEALITEYARALGEDDELVWHAETVMLQPGDSAAHDDHFHLRIACTPEESLAGCLGGGPRWPWLSPLPELAAPTDDELAAALLDDLLPGIVAMEGAAAP